ncbi:uncharacterized protein LOC124277735, partial [Haliotis rubra]|uniref:uncharacterized protein LOC124277735 n=1 Tax=Haliotis rubra TaxID=36100 RepID=UPI001EE586C5
GPEQILFNGTNSTVTAAAGAPLTVRCSADCNPACTVTWWNTSRHRLVTGHREAVLFTPAVDRSGQYTCHVNNTHGNKSRNLTLDKPSAASAVRINVPTVAVLCVITVVVAVAIAISLHRHRAKKREHSCSADADNEEQAQQDPSHLYSKVTKRRRERREDVYTPVKFMNLMYGAPRSSEKEALINNSGERNADGLIYADLDLVEPPLVDGTFVVHRKEEPVVYEEIDFSLTPGPQLPDKLWEVEEGQNFCE